ncbi:MAG: hypothetical protein BM556_13375 [Bacteriovorax sp. MedPE-SWde]|nr:MAG: hypothetical protein BM556_13375 [Bacteriovorax sp. MedPE-SWde]
MKWIILATLSLNTYSLDIKDIEKKGYQVYRIKKDESYKDVVTKLYKKTNQKHMTEEEFSKILKKWNPHLNKVSDFTGQYIYSNYPYSPQTGYQWAPDLYQSENLAMNRVRYEGFDGAMGLRSDLIKTTKRSPANTKSIIENVDENRIFTFAHITTSRGSFSDEILGNKIQSQQNSPITIGAGISFLPKSLPKYSFVTSLYFSSLKASDVNDPSTTVTNTNLDLAPEIGANLYIQRNYTKNSTNIYAGLDYEQFNTFNFDKVINSETTELKAIQQKVIYSTIGIGYRFKFEKPVQVKVSYSLGILSDTELKGNKYMVYFNQRITNRYWYHLLFKKHNLSDNSRETTISRYGIGVGMSF